jgi:hypothetical protein
LPSAGEQILSRHVRQKGSWSIARYHHASGWPHDREAAATEVTLRVAMFAVPEAPPCAPAHGLI